MGAAIRCIDFARGKPIIKLIFRSVEPFVADLDPEKEYQETLDKAKALIDALKKHFPKF